MTGGGRKCCISIMQTGATIPRRERLEDLLLSHPNHAKDREGNHAGRCFRCELLKSIESEKLRETFSQTKPHDYRRIN